MGETLCFQRLAACFVILDRKSNTVSGEIWSVDVLITGHSNIRVVKGRRKIARAPLKGMLAVCRGHLLLCLRRRLHKVHDAVHLFKEYRERKFSAELERKTCMCVCICKYNLFMVYVIDINTTNVLAVACLCNHLLWGLALQLREEKNKKEEKNTVTGQPWTVKEFLRFRRCAALSCCSSPWCSVLSNRIVACWTCMPLPMWMLPMF